jgi:hypothetical protein
MYRAAAPASVRQPARGEGGRRCGVAGCMSPAAPLSARSYTSILLADAVVIGGKRVRTYSRAGAP